MSLSKDNLLRELSELGENLLQKKADLEEAMDNIDLKKSERDEERKKIMLSEIKNILRILSDVDKKVCKDIKADIFDTLRKFTNLKNMIEDQRKVLSCPDLAGGHLDMRVVAEELQNIKSRLHQLPDEVPSLQVAHTPRSELMAGVMKSLTEAIYLKTPELDVQHFVLDCSLASVPSFSVVQFQLETKRQFTSLVQSHLHVLVTTPSSSDYQGRRKLMEASLAELLLRGNQKKNLPVAHLQQNGTRCVVHMIKPHNMVITVEATMLESHVSGSPSIISLLSQSQDREVLDVNSHVENGNSSPGVGDMVGVKDMERYEEVPHHTVTESHLRISENELEESESECESVHSPWRNEDLNITTHNHTQHVGNWNESFLPDDTRHESYFHGDGDLDKTKGNMSVWGEITVCNEGLDFLSLQMVQESFYKKIEISKTSTRSFSVLNDCCDIALYKPRGFNQPFYMITEPKHDRVVTFSQDFSKYFGSFSKAGENTFTKPRDILGTSNGFLVVTDANKLRIFDEGGILVQEVDGEFSGLAEGDNGDILTLKGEFLVCLSQGKDSNSYHNWNLVKLTILETFDNWTSLSRPRHLTYNQGVVYITDMGLHKIIIVHLDSNKQTVGGFFGSELGQFKKPTGIVSDQCGNLLVMDQGNGAVSVFNKEGIFVKDLWRLESNLRLGTALRLVGDTLWITCRGDQGALLEFRLKPNQI